jgi:hypothetical protein
VPAFHQPRPRHNHKPRELDRWQDLVDRWARQATRRPWWHSAAWAFGIGAANLGLRMLLNDLPLAHNACLAALAALGFFLFAWLYTAQLTRPLRRRRAATRLAVPATSGAAVGRCTPGRRHPTGRGPRSRSLWSFANA